MVTAFSAPMTIDMCTIQSLLGLFNNDIEAFAASDTYLDTIIPCLKLVEQIQALDPWLSNEKYGYFRSPYNIKCLAPYGGPIEPGLSVGGGVFDNYTDSSGVGLTFLINNKVNKTELEPVYSWEEK